LVVVIFTLCAATILSLTDTDTARLGHAALPFIDLDQRGSVVSMMIQQLKNSAQTFCSNKTALLLYRISDVNPARVDLTVPRSARLRREHPEWIVIHRANLTPQEISQHEGMPVTSVERSVMDVLSATHRTDIARQAIADALREGLLNAAQASGLRKRISRSTHDLSLLTNGSRVKTNESATS
jgi:predicted transcriptional regulator of viral defense system